MPREAEIEIIDDSTWYGTFGWSHSRLVTWDEREIRFNFHCGIEGKCSPSVSALRSIDGLMFIDLPGTAINIKALSPDQEPDDAYFEADYTTLCQLLQQKFGNGFNRPLNIYDCVKDEEAVGMDYEIPYGVQRIVNYRMAQIEEGDNIAKDGGVDGSLALAAVCYAAPQRIYKALHTLNEYRFEDPWPEPIITSSGEEVCLEDERLRDPHNGLINPSSYNPEDRITMLVKAGALIAAEIDRLKRLEEERIREENRRQEEYSCPENDDIPF